jgi:methionyl-tRNA formyltransferase
MLRALDGLAAGTLEARPQAAEGITYAAKIEKSETRLDWRQSAIELERQVRGLAPFPGAWFGYAGERIKVLEVESLTQEGEPGRVLAPDDLVVGCGQGALRLLALPRLSPAAGRRSGTGMRA